MAKTRSDPNPAAKSKKKKKTKYGPAAAAMKSVSREPKPNPFDVLWSRRKFNVLGRSRRGEEKRVGLARSIAIDKRKNTLMKEYEERGKSSKFMDMRIGERDDSIPEFDKAVLRLQRERQLKVKKNSKYNLSDVEEDDDFEEDIPFDDDDDDDLLEDGPDSSKYLGLHSGRDRGESSTLDEDENVHKTKKQVMAELISKSKFYKAQKAKEKEEDDHLLEKLDQDFASLAQANAFKSLTQKGKTNALKALLNKSSGRQSSKEDLLGSMEKGHSEKEQPDAYDKLVKEMALDMRARPSDRTKTPEEIAQEERERLETLEEERRKRMLATDDSSDEDSGNDDDNLRTGSKKQKHVSGDDLGDSFSVDEVTENRKGFVDAIYDREAENNQEDSSEGSESDEDDEGSDDENDTDGDSDGGANEHGNVTTLKDWEQSDDDNDGDEDDDLNTDEEGGKDADADTIKKIINISKTDNKTSPVEKPDPSGQDTLPFVIEAPSSLAELSSLLDGRSDAEVVEAIKRIRACNSIRLGAENKRKMQVFYAVLLQYFAVSAKQIPLNINLLNDLVKPLMEMSVEIPFYAAICARTRLDHIRKQLCESIKMPDKSSWPSFKSLLLLRLWLLIFPCSDFRHVVTTPAILLMCEYLIRCPIMSGRDIATGSFLCSLVLSVVKQSKKYCPEALIFLQILLMSSIKMEPELFQKYQSNHLMELQTKPWLLIRDQVTDAEPLNLLAVMSMEEECPFFSSDNFKSGILLSVVKTIEGFVNVYKDLSSFSEIFSPVSSLLQEVLQKANLPSTLRENFKDVAQMIKRKIDEQHLIRRPLQIRQEKPEPIRLLNPQFEESFVKGRDYDPDRERANIRKLKKDLKKEAKGAIRELRKDNHFLYGLKEKERKMEEEERAEKYGKARAFLQEQEHAFKSGQLGKGKKRRR